MRCLAARGSSFDWDTGTAAWVDHSCGHGMMGDEIRLASADALDRGVTPCRSISSPFRCKALKLLGARPNEFSILEGDVQSQELYQAFQRLGAKSDLLSIVGSWGDTLDLNGVLSALLEWNGRIRPIRGRRPS